MRTAGPTWKPLITGYLDVRGPHSDQVGYLIVIRYNYSIGCFNELPISTAILLEVIHDTTCR